MVAGIEAAIIGLILINIVLLYIVYRLLPNQIAEKIRRRALMLEYYVFERHKMAERAKSKQPHSTIKPRWYGWDRYREGDLAFVMRVLGGYGGLFQKVIMRKRFYYRELLMATDGNITMARGWLMDAMSLGIVRRKKDSYGVTIYVFDPEILSEIWSYLDRVLGELEGVCRRYPDGGPRSQEDS